MKFYTSDLHFGHDNIIKLCKRPFKNVKEMTYQLIQKWNNKVKPEDEVYILGDVFFKFNDKQEIHNILSSLNGKKYLIRGNHDKWANDKDFQKYFEWIKPYYEIADEETNVVLFHYPIAEWNGFYRNSYHLYGHVHNQEKNLFINSTKCFNVGVDVNDFEPKTLNELIEASNKTLNQIDLFPSDCHCSNCGMDSIIKTNYCANCGAKMEG
jgi:calcineurin-like phosphoesterase family protein